MRDENFGRFGELGQLHALRRLPPGPRLEISDKRDPWLLRFIVRLLTG